MSLTNGICRNLALMSTRAELVNLAKLAEQGERYDDMVEYMKQVSQCSDELKPEERNLLSVAYKNVVGARRTALRILGSIKEKEEKRDPEGFKLQTVNEYRLKLEGELDNLCFDLLDQVPYCCSNLSSVLVCVFRC